MNLEELEVEFGEKREGSPSTTFRRPLPPARQLPPAPPEVEGKFGEELRLAGRLGSDLIIVTNEDGLTEYMRRLPNGHLGAVAS